MVFCYYQGEIKSLEDARLPITNLGLNRGMGVFDLFRARNGTPIFLNDYLTRFENSQKFLSLDAIISKNEIRDAIEALQQRNGFRDSIFKMIFLADGEETDTVFQPVFFILNKPITNDSESKASTLISHEYQREYPEVKTLNYMASFKLQQQRMKAGAVDVLYHQDGFISETSRSNVFVIKNGVIKTPEDVLQGITRKHVISMVRGAFELEIGSVSTTDLWSADEVFITSTLKEIMPIVQIDKNKIGDGSIGKITRELMTQFEKLLNDD